MVSYAFLSACGKTYILFFDKIVLMRPREFKNYPSLRQYVTAMVWLGKSRKEIVDELVRSGYPREKATIIVSVYLSRLNKKFK
jgi:hypothetical protein